MATLDDHKNLAYSTVATAPSPATSGTSLVVAAGEGTRFPSVSFNATIWPASAIPTPANAEIVRVTAISTDTFTITRTQEGTSARTVVVGDQIAATITDKTLTDVESLLDAESVSRGSSGSLASTFDRALHAETNDAHLGNGRLSLYRIFLPKGLSVTNISFWSMTTALSVGSNQWFALFDESRNKLAVTADDTSTAWAANTKKTLAVASGPFVTTYTGWYYLGASIVATTRPSMACASTGSSGANFKIATPVPCGTSDTGLTNPASCPSTATAPTLAHALAYAEIS